MRTRLNDLIDRIENSETLTPVLPQGSNDTFSLTKKHLDYLGQQKKYLDDVIEKFRKAIRIKNDSSAGSVGGGGSK